MGRIKIIFITISLVLLVCFTGLCQTPGSRMNGIFNVRDFGATGDGRHLDSRAINRAIAACSKAGGGEVDFPAGIYLSGSIHLASHIRLHICSGATILGVPAKMKAYDPAEPFKGTAYQDGGHTYFHNSLIWGVNLTDVSITGRGTINGGGLTRRDRGVGMGSIGTGDKSIALKSCSNVLIRDITIIHGGHFGILLTGCNLVTIDNVTIDTNRDGMDLDCCSNTMVSNCRINSPNDDALCIKSSYALQRKVTTENILITNCEVSGFPEGSLVNGDWRTSPGGPGTGRIKFGTESNGGFRNCVISNCTFTHCMGLALEEVDGGTMDGISISNLTMRDIFGYPVYITLGSRNRGPAGTLAGKMRNISIAGIVGTRIDSVSGIQITGLPGDDIEQLSLRNIRLSFKGGGTRAEAGRPFPELGNGYPEPGKLGSTPSWGIFARHIRSLEVTGISMDTQKPDHRPALIFSDVDHADIDHLKVSVQPGVRTAVFTGVKELTMENSPDLQH